MGGAREKKVQYFSKLRELLEEYKSIFVVGVDNVSSQQMHEIRKALRGDAVVLMGKTPWSEEPSEVSCLNCQNLKNCCHSSKVTLVSFSPTVI